MKGIDVSKHNGLIDWARVKESGIDFAIIRAGFGQNNIDPMAERNLQGAISNGIHVGIYWFSYAFTVDMAKKEAQFALQLAKRYKLTFPIFFDFEYDSVKYLKSKGVTFSANLFNKMCSAFCGEIERRGYYAGVYANNDYVKNYVSRETLSNYDLWFASYTIACPRKVNLWQYSSTGIVPGIGGHVDLNIANIDYPTIIKNKGLNVWRG